MNTFRFELKTGYMKTLLWILALLTMCSIYMSVYPAFAKDAAALLETLKKIPEAMRHILGTGGLKQLSFVGFFGSIFPFITLIGAIQAITYGMGILSKEARAKTTDFLLTKPRSRQAVYRQKLLAAFLLLLVSELAVYGGSFVIARLVDAGDFDVLPYTMFWGAFALIQWFMFGLGVFISQAIKKLKGITPPSLGLSFGLFLFALFGMIVGDDAVRWMTPFRFIDYSKIITDSCYDTAHVIYALIWTAVFIAAGYVIYTRKDVESV